MQKIYGEMKEGENMEKFIFTAVAILVLSIVVGFSVGTVHGQTATSTPTMTPTPMTTSTPSAPSTGRGL